MTTRQPQNFRLIYWGANSYTGQMLKGSEVDRRITIWTWEYIQSVKEQREINLCEHIWDLDQTFPESRQLYSQTFFFILAIQISFFLRLTWVRLYVTHNSITKSWQISSYSPDTWTPDYWNTEKLEILPCVTILEWLKPRFKFRLIWLQRPLSSYNTLMQRPRRPLRERKTEWEGDRWT